MEGVEPKHFEFAVGKIEDGFIFDRDRALKIAVSGYPPDLILLDIMMPNMDGYEICRRLEESNMTKKIPVISLTAMTEVENEGKGFELGAVDYITKPVSPPNHAHTA